MTLPTADLIAEVLRLDEEATKGEWKTVGTMIYSPGVDGATVCEISEPRATTVVEHHRLEFGSKDAAEAYANVKLIAHYRTSAPILARAVIDLDKKLREADAALANAATVFRRYAEGHAAKSTREGDIKAAANIVMANACEAARARTAARAKEKD